MEQKIVKTRDNIEQKIVKIKEKKY